MHCRYAACYFGSRETAESEIAVYNMNLLDMPLCFGLNHLNQKVFGLGFGFVFFLPASATILRLKDWKGELLLLNSFLH